MNEQGTEARKVSKKTREATSTEQRTIRNRNRGDGFSADWATANAGKVLDAIGAVAITGCAIRFGYTRDMGAFAVGIVGDGEPYTEYVRPTEDIDLYLDGLISDFRDAGAGKP